MSAAFPKQSALALAIAASSLVVHAETVQLTNTPYLFTPPADGELIFEGATNVSGSAVTIESANLVVKNHASIHATGDLTHAMGFVDTYLGVFGFKGFENYGELRAHGNGAVALDFVDSAVGMETLNRVEGSMRAEGEGAIALRFANMQLAGPLVPPGFSSVWGQIDGGLIAAEGKNSRAIVIDSSNVMLLLNQQVSAEGENAAAIWLKDSTASVGLNNAVVVAEGNGIEVADTQPGWFYQLSVAGDSLLKGGSAAIKAHNNATLNWTGGTIDGNLDGLFTINVEGDVRFAGDLMRTASAGELEVSSGTVTLLKPHTQLESDLYLSGSGQGALEMLLGSSTIASQPVLNVTGSAEFGNGSQIKLTPRPNDFASNTPATNYLLVRTGGSIDNQGLNVQSTSALLEVKSFNVSSNTVEALVAAKSDQGVIDTVKAGGGNQSAQRAQAAFTSGVMSKLDPNNPVYQAFANATSNEQVAALAKQLAPQTNGGATQGARSALGATVGAIGGRSSAARGASTGDVLQEKGLWLQALHSDADQDMRDGIAGYDADSKGIAIGVDGKLNEQTTLGLAYSFLDTAVHSDDGNKTQVDSHALTAYASWQDGPWFVDGSLTYGVNDNESKRYVVGTEAKGDYDSDLVGVNALAGYVYRLNDSVLLEPRVAARYSNVDIDSYREKGSAAALDVGAARFEVGELGAGVRMAGAFALGQGTLEPEAKLMAYHDVIGDKADSTSSFTLGGTPFVTNGASPVRDSYEAGVGVTYKLGALSVGASYDYLGKTDFNADTFNAKVRYDF